MSVGMLLWDVVCGMLLWDVMSVECHCEITCLWNVEGCLLDVVVGCHVCGMLCLLDVISSNCHVCGMSSSQ